jgi:hypothetical protein
MEMPLTKTYGQAFEDLSESDGLEPSPVDLGRPQIPQSLL